MAKKISKKIETDKELIEENSSKLSADIIRKGRKTNQLSPKNPIVYRAICDFTILKSIDGRLVQVTVKGDDEQGDLLTAKDYPIAWLKMRESQKMIIDVELAKTASKERLKQLGYRSLADRK